MKQPVPANSARQCIRKSKRTHERCGGKAMRGQDVCYQHGGASPQARAKAAERLALADALKRDDRRTPAEVLADVGHSADFLMRQARLSVEAGAPTEKLLELTEAAGRWAKTNLDAGTSERQTRVLEGQAAVLVAVVRRILDRLDLTADQRHLVTVVVPEEFQRQHELEAGEDRG